MTTSIRGLHKRLDKLEGSAFEPDYEQEALDALSDEDLDVLQEASALYQSGYSQSHVKEMMGDRWPQVEIAIVRFKAEMDRLEQGGGERLKQRVDHETVPTLAPVNYKAGKRV